MMEKGTNCKQRDPYICIFVITKPGTRQAGRKPEPLCCFCCSTNHVLSICWFHLRS